MGGRPACFPDTAASETPFGEFSSERFMRHRRDQAPPSPTSPVPKHGVWQWAPSLGSRPRGRGCPPVDGAPPHPGCWGRLGGDGRGNRPVQRGARHFFSSGFLFANKTPQEAQVIVLNLFVIQRASVEHLLRARPVPGGDSDSRMPGSSVGTSRGRSPHAKSNTRLGSDTPWGGGDCEHPKASGRK